MPDTDPIAALQSARVPFARWRSGATAPPAPVRVVQGDFRPQVLGPSGRELGEYADEIARHVRDKGIFLLNDEVVELIDKQLQPLRAERFCGWVELHVALRKWAEGEDGQELVPSPMGAQTASKILVAPQFMKHLRVIRRVSQVPLPVWSEDGTAVELLPPGYSERHETYVTTDIKLDESITKDEAVTWLVKEVFAEFPLWKDDFWRSMATIHAMVLMPFCELLVPAGVQRPAFIATANAEGSGKTLLVQFALVPIFGTVSMTTPPVSKESDKLENKLQALVFNGAQYIFIDNWTGEIGGAAIEMFCTAREIRDRVLGKPDIKTAKKTAMLFITGNRAKVSPDMRRRSLVIELFVEETQAELREVKRWIDEPGILAMRERLLSAYWALVRDWASATPRPRSTVKHGTFGAWADVVCAIVENAGLPSPLSPPRLREALDPDLEAFEVLLPLLLEERDAAVREMSSAELMGRFRDLGGLSFLDPEPPDETTPEGEKAARRERGIWGKCLERFMDRKFRSGVRITWTPGARANRKVRMERTVTTVSAP